MTPSENNNDTQSDKDQESINALADKAKPTVYELFPKEPKDPNDPLVFMENWVAASAFASFFLWGASNYNGNYHNLGTLHILAPLLLTLFYTVACSLQYDRELKENKKELTFTTGLFLFAAPVAIAAYSAYTGSPT